MKLEVPVEIHAGATFKKKMAQLILEVYYAKKENVVIGKGDRPIMGILSDGSTFHLWAEDYTMEAMWVRRAHD